MIVNLNKKIIMLAGGVEFVGPNSSVLTFTSGQSTGDTQCTNVAILDNDVLDGQRDFTISLRTGSSVDADGRRGPVSVNSKMPSVGLSIAPDIEDGI